MNQPGLISAIPLPKILHSFSGAKPEVRKPEVRKSEVVPSEFSIFWPGLGVFSLKASLDLTSIMALCRMS